MIDLLHYFVNVGFQRLTTSGMQNAKNRNANASHTKEHFKQPQPRNPTKEKTHIHTRMLLVKHTDTIFDLPWA